MNLFSLLSILRNDTRQDEYITESILKYKINLVLRIISSSDRTRFEEEEKVTWY